MSFFYTLYSKCLLVTEFDKSTIKLIITGKVSFIIFVFLVFYVLKTDLFLIYCNIKFFLLSKIFKPNFHFVCVYSLDITFVITMRISVDNLKFQHCNLIFYHLELNNVLSFLPIISSTSTLSSSSCDKLHHYKLGTFQF